MLHFTKLKTKGIYSPTTSAVREMFFINLLLKRTFNTAACPLLPAAEGRLDFSQILPHISSTISQHLWLQN
jgi:hypothetical protein